ncbi:MAG TPA: hypothetical protein V6C63_00200 [Allocoleopsis sp.]
MGPRSGWCDRHHSVYGLNRYVTRCNEFGNPQSFGMLDLTQENQDIA